MIIPKGVSVIGSAAFAGCSSLTNISIPDSVNRIDESAFSGCGSLTNIGIPEGVISISDYTFSGCYNLKSIHIPNSVTSFGDGAFRGCSKLKMIFLPDGLTTIGIGAFSECSSLTSITVPASVTSVGSETFAGCDSLQKVAFLHPDASASIVFNPDDGLSILDGETAVYCYQFTQVDRWAKNHVNHIVYFDDTDINSIRTITLPDDFRLACGHSHTLPYTIFPEDRAAIAWSTSNPDVVSIDDGTVTALQPGTSIITATTGTASTSVKITAFIESTDFEISASEIWMLASDSMQFSVVSYIPEGSSTNITWSCSDTNKAVIDENGLLTTYMPGDVSIYADSTNDIHRECLLHLFYPVTAVSFSENRVSVPVGGSLTLKANVTARSQSCVNHLVTFASSNDSIATVDEQGVIQGIRKGIVTVTAVSKSGKTAACKVIVGDISNFTLPSAATEIESEAFANLANVVIIVIPASVTSIADDAFAGSDVIIKAPADSFAYHWAESHGFCAEAL